MPFRVFQYTFPAPPELDELNKFLDANRVATVERHVVTTPGGPLLVFVVETARTNGKAASQGGKGKVDYREELSPDDFEVYCRLRTKRKELAIAEGTQLYSVLSNAHMAAMAERRTMTVEAMSAIPGIPKVQVEKFGAVLVPLVTPKS